MVVMRMQMLKESIYSFRFVLPKRIWNESILHEVDWYMEQAGIEEIASLRNPHPQGASGGTLRYPLRLAPGHVLRDRQFRLAALSRQSKAASQ
jgi:hypothetical protein